MKLTLEFNIPEDQYNAWCSYNGMHLYTTITEIQQYVREVQKYDADPKKTIQRIEESIRELHAITGDPIA
jgi:Fe-S-cluster formation regulator IscX/YfhJ